MVVSAVMVFALVTVIVAVPPQLKATVPVKLPPSGRQASSAGSVQLAPVPVPTTHAGRAVGVTVGVVHAEVNLRSSMSTEVNAATCALLESTRTLVMPGPVSVNVFAGTFTKLTICVSLTTDTSWASALKACALHAG